MGGVVLGEGADERHSPKAHVKGGIVESRRERAEEGGVGEGEEEAGIELLEHADCTG